MLWIETCKIQKFQAYLTTSIREKHLSENLLNDPFGGKFTRTKAPEQQKSILKALESELGHVFKINEVN